MANVVFTEMRVGIGCRRNERAEDVRRGGDWRRCVWGVYRVALGETREARVTPRSVRAGAFAGQLRRRIADHSHGLRRGRAVHAMVAAFARAMERILREDASAAFPRNWSVVDGREE